MPFRCNFHTLKGPPSLPPPSSKLSFHLYKDILKIAKKFDVDVAAKKILVTMVFPIEDHHTRETLISNIKFESFVKKTTRNEGKDSCICAAFEHRRLLASVYNYCSLWGTLIQQNLSLKDASIKVAKCMNLRFNEEQINNEIHFLVQKVKSIINYSIQKDKHKYRGLSVLEKLKIINMVFYEGELPTVIDKVLELESDDMYAVAMSILYQQVAFAIGIPLEPMIFSNQFHLKYRGAIPDHDLFIIPHKRGRIRSRQSLLNSGFEEKDLDKPYNLVPLIQLLSPKKILHSVIESSPLYKKQPGTGNYFLEEMILKTMDVDKEKKEEIVKMIKKSKVKGKGEGKARGEKEKEVEKDMCEKVQERCEEVKEKGEEK